MALITKKNKGYAKLGSNLRKCFQVPKDGDCKPEFFDIFSTTVWGLRKIHIGLRCRHIIPQIGKILRENNCFSDVFYPYFVRHIHSS